MFRSSVIVDSNYVATLLVLEVASSMYLTLPVLQVMQLIVYNHVDMIGMSDSIVNTICCLIVMVERTFMFIAWQFI